MKLQHGKQGSKDVLKFQKRKSDLHRFTFARMIKFVIGRQKEKVEGKVDSESSSDNASESSEHSDEDDMSETENKEQ